MPSEPDDPLRHKDSTQKGGRKSYAATLRAVVSTNDFARRCAVGAVGTVALAWFSAKAAVAGLIIAQAVDGFAKELVEQHRLSKRKLWVVTALLLLLQMAQRAYAAVRRVLPPWRKRSSTAAPGPGVGWRAFAISAAAASAVVVTGFTAPELAFGGSIWNRGTTFPIPVRESPHRFVDLRAPVLRLPHDMRIESSGAHTQEYAAAARDARDGPVPVICTPPSGSVFPSGVTVVRCRASDSAGNSAAGSFTIEIVVHHDGAVLWTIPDGIVEEAHGPQGASVSFAAAARTRAGGALDVSCKPQSGSTFRLGRMVVRCSAGRAARSFAIVVRDTTAPHLAVPGDLALGSADEAGRVVRFTVSARDTVDGVVHVTCSPASGSMFRLGTTPVSCSAHDKKGNRAAAKFAVVMKLSNDTQAPSLDLADARTEATSRGGAHVQLDVSAKDERDGNVPVSCKPVSGSLFRVGNTTVNCTAADSSGNTEHGTLTVTVTDATPPKLGLPVDQVVEATSPAGAASPYRAVGHDIVDGEIIAVCNPGPAAVFPLGKTVVTCSVTDAHHNKTTGSFTIVVRDTTPPKLASPANMNVEATNPKGATVKYAVRATDIVDGDVAVSCNPATGKTFPFGSTAVSCTAVDRAGNRVNGSFTVTVGDKTPPVVKPPGHLTLEATSPSGALFRKPFTATATDSVDGPVPAKCESPIKFPLGSTTLSCTATDAHGNVGRATFKVNVLDRTPPQLKLPGDIIISFAQVVTFQATATDVVDGLVPVTCTPPSGSRFFADRTTTVNCSATDAHGNKASGKFDVKPPVIG